MVANSVETAKTFSAIAGIAFIVEISVWATLSGFLYLQVRVVIITDIIRNSKQCKDCFLGWTPETFVRWTKFSAFVSPYNFVVDLYSLWSTGYSKCDPKSAGNWVLTESLATNLAKVSLFIWEQVLDWLRARALCQIGANLLTVASTCTLVKFTLVRDVARLSSNLSLVFSFRRVPWRESFSGNSFSTCSFSRASCCWLTLVLAGAFSCVCWPYWTWSIPFQCPSSQTFLEAVLPLSYLRGT